MIEVPGAGSYSVTVSDANDCGFVVPVNIEAASMTTLSIDELASTTCGLDNGLIALSATGGIEPYQFSVDGGNTFFTTGTISDLSAGDYQILVRDAIECRDEASATILGSSPLDIAIIATPDTFLCTDIVELEVGDFVEYRWSDGSDNATLSVTETGVYQVSVTDSNGCTANASISIVECGEYAIPNVFTPNGDGVNDEFGVFFSGNVMVQSMRIYNRWGKLVYDSPEKWDGTYEGEPHPSDVLIYQIIVQTPTGVEEVKGQLTLLR
jgi:gliding motility-associated-like protein